jgi:hypothetical protein
MRKLIAIVLWEGLIILLIVGLSNQLKPAVATSEELKVVVAMMFALATGLVSALGIYLICKSKVL